MNRAASSRAIPIRHASPKSLIPYTMPKFSIFATLRCSRVTADSGTPKPAGGRDGLIERRVDAPVTVDEWAEALRVGRAQLLDLAVLEDLLDDRMGAAELLENGGVRRVAGAGPAAAGQLQLGEQKLLQLL